MDHSPHCCIGKREDGEIVVFGCHHDCPVLRTRIEAETVAAIVADLREWARMPNSALTDRDRDLLSEAADRYERNDWKRGGHG